MNFVKSTQDVSHAPEQQNQSYHSRQGFGREGGGGGSYSGAGPSSSSSSSSMSQQNYLGSGNMGSRSGYNSRPSGRFDGGSSYINQGFGSSSQQFGGHRGVGGGGGGGGRSQQDYDPPRQRFGSERSFGGGGGYAEKSPPPSSSQSQSQYSGFVKPKKAEQYEGGEPGSASAPAPAPPPPPPSSSTSSTSSVSRSYSAPSMRHPYSGPHFPGSPGRGMMGSSSAGREGGGGGGGPIRAGMRGLGRGPRFGGGGYGRGGSSSGGGGGANNASNDNYAGIEAATAAAARATRDATNPNAKCIVLASGNVHLSKFKYLSEEIKKLKSKRPNAIDTIHSAANIAHVSIQSEIESGPIVRGTGTFFCLVQFNGINVSVSSGLNKRGAKVDAFQTALDKLNKPFKRIVEINGTSKELQASDYEFNAEPPKQTVIKPMSTVVANISGEGDMVNSFQKESNVEALMDIKKKNYVAKEIGDFVLVEPQEHNSSVNGASILRRSADFSKMLLEYDFAAFGSGGSVRCVLKLEGKVLADVVAHSKVAAKVESSQKAVDVLRDQCWTILTKQVHDSNTPEISKDELFDDLATCFSTNSSRGGGPAGASISVPIADSNKGKKLLEKMGWKGGGMGKDGAGIEEPVTMKQVINREGLGLDAKRGISGDFRARIAEILESYTASERQDDLVFSPHFRKDERILIHNECRRLNLKSKSNGQGGTRYLIVRRKRSAFQLLEHVTRCGGETARYKVVPPCERRYPWRSSLPFASSSSSSSFSSSSASGGGGMSKSQSSSSSATKSAFPSSSSSSSMLPGQAPGGLMASPPMMGAAVHMLAQMEASMRGQNSPGGAGMMGRNSPGMGMGGPNGPAGMMGRNSPGMMGPGRGLPMGMGMGMAMSLARSGQSSMMGQSHGGGGGGGSGGLLGSKPGHYHHRQ